MPDTLLPILYGLLVWWASTGGALYAVGLADRAPRAVLAGSLVLSAGSLAALAATAGDGGTTGVYLAFTAAIGLWGAQEILFLTGWVTGPWRAPCPAGLGGWARAGYAVRAILYHELALLASGAAAILVTAGGANRTGAWTFAILFVMRVSAKLNVFLGVPNLTEGFLPGHLAYLKSFFARKPMNLLFPVSVTACTVALVVLWQRAGLAGDAGATGPILLATLVALALLEHWFLVLPLPVEALWTWGLASRSPAVEAGAPDRPAPAGLGTVVRLDPHVTGAAGPAQVLSLRDRRTVALRPEEGARRRP